MNTIADLSVARDTAPWRAAARRLFDDKKREGWCANALHLYRSADGVVLYARARMSRRTDNGTLQKLIRPFWCDSGRWVVGEPLQDSGKVLYGLCDVLAAPDAFVIVTEGEQKADALTKIGGGRFVGVTSGSATSAGGADWSPLVGRTVLLWPDNDTPGARYANDVFAALATFGCNVRRLNVAVLDLPAHGDAMDWQARFESTHSSQPRADDVLSLPWVEQAVSPGPHTSIQWPLIRPLPPVSLLPVQPFDMALMPVSLRPWMADIAERMQCPRDFLGATIMCALGIVIGRRVGVRPKEYDDWTEYANQWVCVIGRPSVMKSPVDNVKQHGRPATIILAGQRGLIVAG